MDRNSIETRRRLLDFSHELDIARFMLAMSYKQPGKDPYLDLFEEKDFCNEFKHNYYRQHYILSAVIWYHNSFDLMMQCLWFFHKLYNKELNDNNFQKIITDCSYKKIVDKLYKDADNPFKSFKEEYDDILDLANALKHRLFVSSDIFDLYGEILISKKEDYHSEETKKECKLLELQSKLMNFHKDLIKIAKEILIPIKENLKESFYIPINVHPTKK